MSQSIFQDVVYYITETFSEPRTAQITTILESHGAKRTQSLEDCTHVIANTSRFEGYRTVSGDKVVTDFWVERSVALNKQQVPRYFSVDPGKIFSGVVACCTESLDPADHESLSVGIEGLGGRWSTGLTKECTHLFTLDEHSDKYRTAMHYQSTTGIKVLLPHWFDDAVRLGFGGLPTEKYEFPDPPVCQPPPSSGIPKVSANAEKQALFRSTLWNEEAEGDLPAPITKDNGTGTDVWKGRSILLGTGLGISAHRRAAIEAGVERAGGKIVRLKDATDVGEELDALEIAEVLVTKFRAGKAYVKAYRTGKTIGTLSWLFHVQATGVMTPPMDQLLHYPIRPQPIEGFDKEEITVTNYTGDAREYIKKLIQIMGAQFTPSMSQKNTILIAAHTEGNKATKAQNWGIPIVNHYWIEDCFIQWRRLSPAKSRYIEFPPQLDFSGMLGSRGISASVLDAEIADEGDGAMIEEEPVQGTSAPAAADGHVEEPGDDLDRQRGNTNGDVTMDIEMDLADEGYRTPSPPPEKPMTPRSTRSVTRKRNASISLHSSPVQEKAKGNTTKAIRTTSRSRSRSRTRKTPTKLASEKKTEVTSNGRKVPVVELGDDEDDDDDLPDHISPLKRIAKAKVTGSGEELTKPGSSTKKGRKLATDPEAPEEELTVMLAKPKRAVYASKTKRGRLSGVGAENEDEEDPTPSKKPGNQKAKALVEIDNAPSTSKRRSSRKVTSRDQDDMDVDEESEIVEALSPGKIPRRRSKASTRGDEQLEHSADEKQADRPTRRTRSRQADKDETAASIPETVGKKKDHNNQAEIEVKSGKRSVSKAKAVAEAVVDDETDQDDNAPAKGNKHVSATSKDKRKAKPGGEEDTELSEAEEEQPLPAKRSRSRSLKKKGDGKSTNEENAAQGAQKPKRMLTKRPSVVISPVVIAGKLVGSPSKEDSRAAERLPERNGTEASTSSKPTRTKSAAAAIAERGSSPGPSRRASTGNRTPSRRGAAARATQKLHDEVMPDMNSFENQKKRANARKSAGGADTSLVDYEVDPSRKRAQDDVNEYSKKKRRKMDSDSEDEVKEEAPGKKKGKSDAKMDASDEGSKARVKLVTTQVELSESVEKKLIKLGMKKTSTYAECTHLLAKNVVRTEKFMVALASAPWILTEKWATDSAKAGAFQPEEKYLLKDTSFEKEHGCTISQVLERARENDKHLFQGKRFTYTRDAGVDPKILKNVISANGGDSKQAELLVGRTFVEGKDLIISSLKDLKIWQPIYKSQKIYTKDLIWRAALTQSWDFDWEAYRLRESR